MPEGNNETANDFGTSILDAVARGLGNSVTAKIGRDSQTAFLGRIVQRMRCDPRLNFETQRNENRLWEQIRMDQSMAA